VVVVLVVVVVVVDVVVVVGVVVVVVVVEVVVTLTHWPATHTWLGRQSAVVWHDPGAVVVEGWVVVTVGKVNVGGGVVEPVVVAWERLAVSDTAVITEARMRPVAMTRGTTMAQVPNWLRDRGRVDTDMHVLWLAGGRAGTLFVKQSWITNKKHMRRCSSFCTLTDRPPNCLRRGRRGFLNETHLVVGTCQTQAHEQLILVSNGRPGFGHEPGPVGSHQRFTYKGHARLVPWIAGLVPCLAQEDGRHTAQEEARGED